MANENGTDNKFQHHHDRHDEDQNQLMSSCYTPAEQRLTLSWTDLTVSLQDSPSSNKNKTTSNYSPSSFSNVVINKLLCRQPPQQQQQHHHSSNNNTGKNKVILSDCYGYARASELTVIIGSSGAGKSTLMNVLAGRIKHSLKIDSGQVLVNNTNNSFNSFDITTKSSYLQQDDVFHPLLTVGETMWFYGKLRNSNKNREKIEARNHDDDEDGVLQAKIDKILHELGLSRVVDVLVGDPFGAGGGGGGGGAANKKATLSGGERKRLAFAIESLSNPPVFFCDEPTTGLDAFMAETVVTTLKYMAKQGKTVLVTLHQPSSYMLSLFDNVIVMKDGGIAFLGSTEQLGDYFANTVGSPCPSNFNLFDHVIAAITQFSTPPTSNNNTIKNIGDDGDTWPSRFLTSPQYQKNRQTLNDLCSNKNNNNNDLISGATPLQSNNNSGFGEVASLMLLQYQMTIWRQFKVFKRNRVLFVSRSLAAASRAILLALIFANQQYNQLGVTNMIGLIYLMNTMTTWENIDAYMTAMPKEMAVYLRDQQLSLYSPAAHFVAIMAFEVPQNLLNTWLFTTVIYFATNLNSIEAPLHYAIALSILWTTALTSTGVGYLIGFVFENQAIAVAVRRGIAPLFTHTSGVWVNLDTIPAAFSWLRYISIMYYANELLELNQWTDVDYISCSSSGGNTDNDSSSSSSCFNNGRQVLSFYGYSSANIVVDVCAILGLLVVLRLLAYFALVIRTRRLKNEA